jgi:flavin-dependent dehydrogenase
MWTYVSSAAAQPDSVRQSDLNNYARSTIGTSEYYSLKRARKWVIAVKSGANVGAHILSGAVIQTGPLEELFPNWKDDPPKPITPAKHGRMKFLTRKTAIPIPEPPQMGNKGNYIVSLSNFTKWLAEKAEELGVEIYPGFGASEVSRGACVLIVGGV